MKASIEYASTITTFMLVVMVLIDYINALIRATEMQQGASAL